MTEQGQNHVSQLLRMAFFNGPAVEVEERKSGSSRGSFVPVEEGVSNGDRNKVRGRHVKQVEQILTGVSRLGCADSSFQRRPVADAWIAARLLDLTTVDEENLVDAEEERSGHLPTEFVQGPAMSLGYGLIRSLCVDSSNQEAISARNDLHGVAIPDLQQFEERRVEDKAAAVPDLLQLLKHVLPML